MYPVNLPQIQGITLSFAIVIMQFLEYAKIESIDNIAKLTIIEGLTTVQITKALA